MNHSNEITELTEEHRERLAKDGWIEVSEDFPPRFRLGPENELIPTNSPSTLASGTHEAILFRQGKGESLQTRYVITKIKSA